MDKLVELLDRGIITMRIVTLLVVAVTCYMWLARIPVSESQQTATMLVLGFYFGGESWAALGKRIVEKWIDEGK